MAVFKNHEVRAVQICDGLGEFQGDGAGRCAWACSGEIAERDDVEIIARSPARARGRDCENGRSESARRVVGHDAGPAEEERIHEIAGILIDGLAIVIDGEGVQPRLADAMRPDEARDRRVMRDSPDRSSAAE